MNRPRIASRRDPDRPEPWAEVEVVDGSLSINVEEINGVAPFRDAEERRLRGRALPGATRAALDRARNRSRGPRGLTLTTGDRDETAPDLADRPRLEDEVHVLAVTLDGDLEFVPESKQRPAYYAHLGWYDPTSGEWTALEFVDPTDEESAP